MSPIKEKPKKEVPKAPEMNTAVMILRGNVKVVNRGPGKMQIIKG